MASTGMSGPYIGLKKNGAMPYFRDLAAVQIMAHMVGTMGQVQLCKAEDFPALARLAVQAADALEAALEKK